MRLQKEEEGKECKERKKIRNETRHSRIYFQFTASPSLEAYLAS